MCLLQKPRKELLLGRRDHWGRQQTWVQGRVPHLEADCLGPFDILGLLGQFGILELLGQFGILGRGFRQVPCKKRGSGRQEKQAEEPGTEVVAEAHEPGAQQPPGHTQALLQLPLSVGAGVQRILQLGHQPGRNPPEAQPEAAARRAPAAPAWLGTQPYLREQLAGSIRVADTGPGNLPPGRGHAPSFT